MTHEKFLEIVQLVRAIFEIVFDFITKDEVDDGDISNLVDAIKNLRD